MAKQSILELIIKTIKQGDGDKKVVSGLVAVKQIGRTVTNTFAALAGTAYVMNQAFNLTVGTTVELADKIRGIQQVSRLSAEESSKLVQIVDDFKISEEELQKVMQKNGDVYDYSIAGLAQMSDSYLSLSDSNEKAAFMQERFGKNWGTFVELMEQGGDKIRAAGDGINDALIFDQEALDSARDYQAQIDELGDSWTALKVAAGRNVLPSFNNYLTEVNLGIEAQKRFNENIAGESALYQAYAKTIGYVSLIKEEERQITLEQKLANMDLAEGMKDGLIPALDGVTTSTEDAAAAAAAASEANQNFLSMLGSAQGVYEGYIEKNKQLADERAQLEQEKSGLIAQGYSEQSSRILEINGKLEENKKKSAEVATQFELDNKKIMLGYLERKLTADGTLTDSELTWLLEKGEAWGIYSEEAIEAMRAAMDEADSYIDKLNEIPTSITTTIGTTTSEIPASALYPEYVPKMQSSDSSSGFFGEPTSGKVGTSARNVNIYGAVTVYAQGSVVDVLEELGA